MALPNLPFQKTLNQYTASGTDNTFNYNYYITQDADLVVYLNDQLQTLNSDYTVTQNGDPTTGGTVVFDADPTAGTTITIYRNVLASYDFNFEVPITISGINMDSAYQKDIMVAQQTQTDLLLRALKYAKYQNVPYNPLDNLDATVLPLLGLNQVWLGLANGNIQAYTLTQNDGILRSQLADNQEGQDGALLVGLYLPFTSIGLPANTSVHAAVAALVSYMNVLQNATSGGDGATQIGFYNHNTSTATNVAAALEGITQLQFAEKPLINSNLWVWQRGTSFNFNNTLANFWVADRWTVTNGGENPGAISFQRVNVESLPILSNIYAYSDFCALISYSSGGAGNYFNYTNIISGAASFNGQTITTTWGLYNSSGSPIIFQMFALQYFGSGGSPSEIVQFEIGSPITINPNTFGFYSITGAIPSTASKVFGTNRDSNLQLFLNTNTSFSGLYSTFIDVNIGANPVAYLGRDYATELNACRAFRRMSFLDGSYSIPPLEGPLTAITEPYLILQADSSVPTVEAVSRQNVITVNFDTDMIATPTVTVYSGTAANQVGILNASTSRNEGVSVSGVSTKQFTINGLNPPMDGDYGIRFDWVADTGL